MESGSTCGKKEDKKRKKKDKKKGKAPGDKDGDSDRDPAAAVAEAITVTELIEMTKKRSRDSDGGVVSSGTDAMEKKIKKKKKIKKETDYQAELISATHTLSPSLPTPASFPTPDTASDGVDPFPYLEEDCCETQSIAYENIAPLLDRLAKQLNKTRATLRIYDPYFCEGAMVTEMNSLGFLDVYNRREDFYAKQELQEIPEYDVLVTNPPYSGDHVEKLLTFCIQSQKPYFLLMPNYVYMKPYYLRLFSNKSPLTNALFYITPLKRLLYTTPKGRRQQKSGKFTSPFPTFWYCYLGQQWASQTDAWTYAANKSSTTCNIARRVYQLPVEVLTDSDPRKKKERDKLKRAKNKARKKAKPL